MTAPAPRYAILDSRGVLAVEGRDRVVFLQGLVTNDVASLYERRLLYAWLLTAQGKYLFDFFMTQNEETIFLDLDSARVDPLSRKLQLYKLRSDIFMENRSNYFCVVAVFGGHTPPLDEAFSDPRVKELGQRILAPRYKLPELQNLLEQRGITQATEEDYILHRLALGVPEGAEEIEPEYATLLECNMDALGAISWDKGCYMGQELTARMKYRGLVKRRLLPFSADPAAVLTPGTRIVAEDGRETGDIRRFLKGHGLAMIRLDRFDARASYRAGEIPVHLHIPGWLDL